MKNKFITAMILVFLQCSSACSQTTTRNIKTREYQQLQKQLATGWNTWYNNSVMSYVLLPESFAINLYLMDGKVNLQREYFKVSKAAKRQEEIVLGLRSDDGSYTSLTCKLRATTISVQTATEGDDIVILITPQQGQSPRSHRLIIEPSILWNRPGLIGSDGSHLVGKFEHKTITVSSMESPVEDPYAPATVPHFIFTLDREIHLYTGKPKTNGEINGIIERKRKEQIDRTSQYGELTEAFKAMQTILSWNVIYDASNERVISPVSRWWNAG